MLGPCGTVCVQKVWVNTANIDPTTNPNSVSTIADCPLPTANSVPDAHDPPTCMPTPNRKAPTTSPMPIGLVKPRGSPASANPDERITANSTDAVASMSMCARIAAPCPTATSCRQPEVKPNREWNNVKPRARPSAAVPTIVAGATAPTPTRNRTARTRPSATTGHCGGAASRSCGP